MASHDKLEDSNSGSSLTFPEFWISIKSLEHIKCLDRVVELAHFVAVVGDQVEEGEALIGGLHVDVDLPGEVGFLVHDVRAAEP